MVIVQSLLYIPNIEYELIKLLILFNFSSASSLRNGQTPVPGRRAYNIEPIAPMVKTSFLSTPPISATLPPLEMQLRSGTTR